MSRTWSSDSALPDYEATTIELKPEDDGQLVATVLRRRLPEMSRRAVLYVHGFVDYFFHDHVASAFNALGWDFYAVDLRRCGRSLRPGNRPNYCRDLSEYDTELTAAIDIIRIEDAHDILIVIGHSMGGLIASLYADSGERRDSIDGLVLNSPFFGFMLEGSKRLQLPIAGALGMVLPYMRAAGESLSPRYGESISAAYDGEWEYDERWKPLTGFPAYYGWVRAIRRGLSRVARGLAIECPVLLLHASKSMHPGDRHDQRHATHDIVLDVAHMREHGRNLGKQVTLRRIEDGMHDLFLSREPVRTKALEEVFKWIGSAIGEKRIAVREFRT
jgi:alpha-beta hydrolase superfamily lysophospholipase